MDSVYVQISKIGVEIDHHESDLYVRDTYEVRRILENTETNYSVFRDENNEPWLDVPFAYEPFWASRIGKR